MQGIRRLSRWGRRACAKSARTLICVESPPAGFQGAALHEINTQPCSQCQGPPLFGALQPFFPWRTRPGGRGRAAQWATLGRGGF